ncbi:uncharacterized protein LOC132314016 [Cornus florida]|uniref:uncharacterized protein LOC132314016 n=1 Tax=Cornus florida TaxID=4283 RepID=UPI0028A23240|nr:uncharacterized protein LOC132314016 [Cornus florida]
MANEEHSELERILEFLQREIDENRSCNTQSLVAGEVPAPRVHGLYEVPDVLLEQNRDAYTPSCVSIGPFYRRWWRGADLNEMVAVKKRYMCELLERNGTFGATLRECTEAMLKLNSLVKECYSKLHFCSRYGDWDYVEFMVIDGCFIIELLYRKYVEMSDPILQNHLKYHQVRRDLLLLENQIPFVVLEELFRLTVERIPDSTTAGRRPVSLRRCVLSFFGDMMGLENIGVEIENLENNSPFHILYFLHISHQSPLQKPPIFYRHMEKPRFKYSATKLHSIGVKYFTSHALAMSILMASAEDVKLLEEAGVIRNHLDSDEAVLELFKNITSNESIARNQDLLYKDIWR